MVMHSVVGCYNLLIAVTLVLVTSSDCCHLSVFSLCNGYVDLYIEVVPTTLRSVSRSFAHKASIRYNDAEKPNRGKRVK